MPQLKELDGTGGKKHDGGNEPGFCSGKNKTGQQYPEDFIQEAAKIVVNPQMTVAGIEFCGKSQWNDQDQQNSNSDAKPGNGYVFPFHFMISGHSGDETERINVQKFFTDAIRVIRIIR